MTDSLYFIQAADTGMIKVGRSKNPKKRLQSLQTGCGNRLKLIAVFEGQGWREKEIHRDLREFRKEGEWFDVFCTGSLPIDLYEQIPWGSFDFWWEKRGSR